MKHFLFLISATLLLQSCSEDFFSQTVSIDPPPYTKQLSFHMRLSDADSTVSLTMTRNYGILQDVKNYEDWFISGASAEIYENGQKWLTLSPLSQDSAFILVGVLPHKLKPGNTYEIRAEHPDFPKTSATQVMPNDFVVDSLRVRYKAVPGEFGDRLDLMEVFLQDNPNEKNYYEITLWAIFYQVIYNPNTFQNDTIGTREYPVYVDGYTDPNVQYGVDNGALITDQFFDGKPYKFQARFYSDQYNIADSTLIVRVKNVTEEYYKWSRSYQAVLDVEDNPLVEPIAVFNNLKDGLGIFGLSHEKVYKVR